MTLILFAGIGFLGCVLWIDLIFDSLVVPYLGKPGPLPEPVLATMTHFFRRLTGRPIFIFIVMLTMLAVLILQLVQRTVPQWVSWVSLVLFVVPTGLAASYIIPTARRFASGRDPLEKQSQLARSLIFLHGFCLILIISLAVVQLYASSLK